MHAPGQDDDVSPFLWQLRRRLLPRLEEPLLDYICGLDESLPGTASDGLDAARSYRFLDWLHRQPYRWQASRPLV